LGSGRAGRSVSRRRSRPSRGAGGIYCERVPLQWATTQNNLGNALREIGERESGTQRLEEAVAAFRAALEEWTRERVPLQWAFTQMNLASVYRALFNKDHQLRHLDDALKAADGGLEEFRKANAAYYIDKAEQQRAEILALKGAAEPARGAASIRPSKTHK
jgi:tetratricopeptide (TPR) repeat protein